MKKPKIKNCESICSCRKCPEKISVNCKNYCKRVQIKDRYKRIRFINEIPTWCPLEDYKEGN